MDGGYPHSSPRHRRALPLRCRSNTCIPLPLGSPDDADRHGGLFRGTSKDGLPSLCPSRRHTRSFSYRVCGEEFDLGVQLIECMSSVGGLAFAQNPRCQRRCSWPSSNHLRCSVVSLGVFPGRLVHKQYGALRLERRHYGVDISSVQHLRST